MVDIKKLYALLNQVSKREKLMLYVTIIISFSALFDRVVIHSISSKLAYLNKKIERTKAGIAKSLRVLAQEDRIIVEKKQYAPLLKNIQSGPDTMTSVLKTIEGIANGNSVYIIDMKPTISDNVNSSKKYYVTLSCEMQMTQLIDFMYAIELSDQLSYRQVSN